LAYSCGPGRGPHWLLSALLFSSSLSLLPSLADYLARMKMMKSEFYHRLNDAAGVAEIISRLQAK
jgi:hypothetical protein